MLETINNLVNHYDYCSHFFLIIWPSSGKVLAGLAQRQQNFLRPLV